MSDRMEDAESCHERSSGEEEKSSQQGGKSQTSYKDSLLGFKGMGFNGIAYGSSDMEEDPLLSDLLDKEWKLPERPEEMKHLLQVYPAMRMTEEEFNEECRLWNNALIMGAGINLYRLKDHLGRIWGFNDLELIDLPNNYFVVRFKDEENWGVRYKRVLFEGPWVAAQHSILVQRWSPYFDPFQNPLGRIATWIRIPNILLHCYSKRYMWRLGDMIGRTIKVDLHTIANTEDSRAKVTRGHYARICVELDLRKKLTSALFNIEYEGLGLICFVCGRYGHRREECPWKKAIGECSESVPSPEKNNIQQRGSPVVNILAKDDQFGPWTLVQKPRKNRIPRREGQSRGVSFHFVAIADIGEADDVTYDSIFENRSEEKNGSDEGKALVIYEERREKQKRPEANEGPYSKSQRKDGTPGKMWVKAKICETHKYGQSGNGPDGGHGIQKRIN